MSKIGLIVEFRMPTDAAEQDLVSRFNLQEVNPDVKLNLGKYGKILVKDIYGMTRIAGPKPAEPQSPFNVSMEDLFPWSKKT